MQAVRVPGHSTSAGHGWPSVPVAMDGEKGPCLRAGGTRPHRIRVMSKDGQRSLRNVKVQTFRVALTVHVVQASDAVRHKRDVFTKAD